MSLLCTSDKLGAKSGPAPTALRASGLRSLFEMAGSGSPKVRMYFEDFGSKGVDVVAQKNWKQSMGTLWGIENSADQFWIDESLRPRMWQMLPALW